MDESMNEEIYEEDCYTIEPECFDTSTDNIAWSDGGFDIESKIHEMLGW